MKQEDFNHTPLAQCTFLDEAEIWTKLNSLFRLRSILNFTSFTGSKHCYLDRNLDNFAPCKQSIIYVCVLSIER